MRRQPDDGRFTVVRDFPEWMSRHAHEVEKFCMFFDTAEQAQAALQLPQQISGRLRIALADSVCSTFLPDLLLHYHARCPEVELVLRTATADEMLQWLSSNEVDLAYTLDQPILQPNLVLAFNELEPICMVAPPNHPLARQEVVTLEELAKQEFLLTERGMSYRDALDQCMDAHQKLRSQKQNHNASASGD